ncbi:MAG TPA: OFA family MFS transporter [Polyangiaceae bacterium]|nr:OFA family MFS transporter [Polyangiaceae bacterium]
MSEESSLEKPTPPDGPERTASHEESALEAADQGPRVRILISAVLVQLALGSVYAWSVFNKPLQTQFGWTKPQTVLPFETAIGCIVIGALLGGRAQDRHGPRPVALIGGFLYAAGIMLASCVHRADQLWLLTLGYGVIGGTGLGAVYITPIAMLAKWFPERRGLVTGLAVGGFGFGSVLAAPLARSLLANAGNKPSVFLPLGLAYLVLITLGALSFRNPSSNKGGAGPKGGPQAPQLGQRELTLSQALRTPAWYQLTAILLLNVTAGIGLISQASDAAQELGQLGPSAAAALVGIFGLFNGAGRVFYAGLSDRLGRMSVCSWLLFSQAVALALLPLAHGAVLFFILAALVYTSYGGGFGVMPAASADFFGTKHAGSIYGAMIVAWSLGGVVGPLLAAALYEVSGSYRVPFWSLAALALVSSLLPRWTRRPQLPPQPAETKV